MPHLILLRGGPGSGKTDVASKFAGRYAFEFVEVDAVKRERHGTAKESDDEDFLKAGHQAKRALDAGNNVIVEEFFNSEPFIRLFLGPTGLNLQSPNLVPVRLYCDVEVAVGRKAVMDKRIVREAHGLTPRRFILPDEIALDSTSATVEQIVNRMVEALVARGLNLVERPGSNDGR